MPDALSKTIPIWCAIMNMTLFPDMPEYHQLHVPPQVISPSEKAQIEDRLTGFLQQFQELHVDMTSQKESLTKPLRPLWMTRDSILPEDVPSFEDFYPLVLCTSSRHVMGAELSEGGYIQGAGDDNESWSDGLTPQIFWKNHDILLSTAEGELLDLIKELIRRDSQQTNESCFINIKSAPQLFFGKNSSIADLKLLENDFLISCGIEMPKILSRTRHIHLKCRSGKLGSRDLRTKFLDILQLLHSDCRVRRLYIACSDGKDLSIGIGLAVLCLFFDDQGIFKAYKGGENAPHITKLFIRRRLSWITTSIPEASLSRATLQSVSGFLFSSSTMQGSSVEGRENPKLPSSSIDVSSLFSSLEGRWQFQRKLANHGLSTQNRSLNAGVVKGIANFNPSPPQSQDEKGDPSFLYLEEGIMELPDGNRLQVHRKWIWELKSTPESSASPEWWSIKTKNGTSKDLFEAFTHEIDGGNGQLSDQGIDSQIYLTQLTPKQIRLADTKPFIETRSKCSKDNLKDSDSVAKYNTIAIYFVRLDGSSKDYVYQYLDFEEDLKLKSTHGEQVIYVDAEHLCNKDMYTSKYTFTVSDQGTQGSSRCILRFIIEHNVKGPTKDYTSVTEYTPE
jgi:tRNA A64-2'-O-ribosylphosphate transferase